MILKINSLININKPSVSNFLRIKVKIFLSILKKIKSQIQGLKILIMKYQTKLSNKAMIRPNSVLMNFLKIQMFTSKGIKTIYQVNNPVLSIPINKIVF